MLYASKVATFLFIKKGKRKNTKTKRGSESEYLRYKETCRLLVHARLSHYAEIYSKHSYDMNYKRVAIRDQRSRWGSCSSRANLNFNYRLVLLPMHLVDYIIVHELCHLIHMNHAKEFWDLVSVTCPDYKNCKIELQKIIAKK